MQIDNEVFSRHSYSSLLATQRRLPMLINVMRFLVIATVLALHVAFGDSLSRANYFVDSPLALYAWVGGYGMIVTALMFFPGLRRYEQGLPSPVGMIDIMMMAILMKLTGGVDGGFGFLILPFIATSCLYSAGYHALAYSSFATLLVFGTTLWDLDKPAPIDDKFNSVFQAGLLSLACVFVGALTSYASRNVKAAYESIKSHEAEIARLHRINELIIENSTVAIVAADKSGKAILFNARARKSFPELARGRPFAPAIEAIALRPDAKESGVETHFSHNTYDYIATSKSVKADSETVLAMFIRSSADMEQESKANKLASLGQLTANLAHEVRNPLSAITHACELLQESMEDASGMRARMGEKLAADRAFCRQIEAAPSVQEIGGQNRPALPTGPDPDSDSGSDSTARADGATAESLADRLSQRIEESEEIGRKMALAQHLQDIIEGNCGRIDKMIQEILTLNRQDLRKPQLLDLVHFLERFRQEFFLSIPDSVDAVDCFARAPACVWVDPDHMSQILWNLTSNAWKYCAQRPHSVSIELTAQGRKARVSVSDDGPGVPEDYRPHIFEPFFTKSSGGTGLGLYIARELAESNGGALNYFPKYNEFILELPLADPNPDEPRNGALGEAGSKDEMAKKGTKGTQGTKGTADEKSRAGLSNEAPPRKRPAPNAAGAEPDRPRIDDGKDRES